MATRVHSYGTVPVHHTPDGPQFLIIHMYGSAGGTHWSFPKGRPEPDETPIQTARRETVEEVGIAIDEIITDPAFSHTYTFSKDGDLIEKTVTHFIAIITNPAFTLQEEEIKEARWCGYREAREQLTYEQSKQLLDDVVTRLESV